MFVDNQAEDQPEKQIEQNDDFSIRVVITCYIVTFMAMFVDNQAEGQPEEQNEQSDDDGDSNEELCDEEPGLSDWIMLLSEL